MFPDKNAEIAYYSTLQGYETLARSSLDAFRIRLAAWEADARARGVTEANVIAVLQSTNLWDQATADLADVAIPTEIKRVQQGGEPLPSLTAFAPTAPPTLPDIDTVLASQGGSKTGTAQYTGGSVTLTPPPVSIAPVVASSPTDATAAAIANVAPSIGASVLPAMPVEAAAIDAAVPPNPVQETNLGGNSMASLSLAGSAPTPTAMPAPAPAPSPTAAIPWLWAVVALLVVVAAIMLYRKAG